MNDITVPQLLQQIAKKYPDIPAQYSKNEQGDFIPLPYSRVMDLVLNFSAGLLALGVKRGDRIGLIADNRKEWYHASMGIMAIGACDVPRGCDATEQDLVRFLSFAECSVAVLENQLQLIKILKRSDQLPLLKTLILLDPIDKDAQEVKDAGDISRFTLYSYTEIIGYGTFDKINHAYAFGKERK